jgi:hypothetical protein
MSSVAERYVKEMHKKFDLYAAWPPNEARALGDVGKLVGGQFQRLTSLKDLGISFKVRVGPVADTLSYTSGKKVEVSFNAAANTPPALPGAAVKADASVEFSGEGAFLFQALQPSIIEIEDQMQLAQQILDLFKTIKNGQRMWRKDWSVVTSLITAERVTVLISNSKSAKIGLAGQGILPAAPAPLASAKGRLSVSYQDGEVTSVLAAANLTPLFRLNRVRRSFIDRILGGDSSADIVRAGMEAGAPTRVLELVPIKDALGRPTRAWADAPTTTASPPAKPAARRPAEKVPKKATKKAVRKIAKKALKKGGGRLTKGG